MVARIQSHVWHRVSLSVVISALICGSLLIPLGYITLVVLQTFDTIHISDVITSRMWFSIWFSIWQSFVTVLCSLVLGGGFAWLEYSTKARTNRWFLIIMTLPIFIPSVVVGLGFVAVWGNSGYINDLLNFVGIGKIHLLYSPKAIIASHLFYNLPLAYIAIRLRLMTTHHYLDDTAKVLGASWWQRWCTIMWPRLRSTIFGVSIVIFLYSFMSFALPLLLGGIRYQTLEVYIYTLITQQYNFMSASVLALLQLIGLGLVVMLGMRFIHTVPEMQVKIAEVRYQTAWYIQLGRCVLALYILLPLIAVIVRGVPGNSWQLLQAVQFEAAWVRSFVITMLTMVGVCVVATVVTLTHSRWQRWIVFTLAVSPITLGFAWRLLFGQHLWLLPIVYTSLLLPVTVYILHIVWEARPPNLINTVKILGGNLRYQIKAASRWLAPAYLQISALCIAFVFGDLAVTSLLVPYAQPTAMSLSYELLGNYRFSIAATGTSIVLITIIISISVLFIVLYKKLYKNIYKNKAYRYDTQGPTLLN